MIRKVNPQDALQIAPLMMQALLQMLSSGSGVKVVGGVQEDALMAIGTLVEGMYTRTRVNKPPNNAPSTLGKWIIKPVTPAE